MPSPLTTSVFSCHFCEVFLGLPCLRFRCIEYSAWVCTWCSELQELINVWHVQFQRGRVEGFIPWLFHGACRCMPAEWEDQKRTVLIRRHAATFTRISCWGTAAASFSSCIVLPMTGHKSLKIEKLLGYLTIWVLFCFRLCFLLGASLVSAPVPVNWMHLASTAMVSTSLEKSGPDMCECNHAWQWGPENSRGLWLLTVTSCEMRAWLEARRLWELRFRFQFKRRVSLSDLFFGAELEETLENVEISSSLSGLLSGSYFDMARSMCQWMLPLRGSWTFQLLGDCMEGDTSRHTLCFKIGYSKWVSRSFCILWNLSSLNPKFLVQVSGMRQVVGDRLYHTLGEANGAPWSRLEKARWVKPWVMQCIFLMWHLE